MRSATVPLSIPVGLVQEARLYASNPHDLDAVCHVLSDYGRLVAELRQIRQRLAQLDQEEAAFDARLQALQDACRALLDL